MNPFLNEYDTPFGVPPFDKIKHSDYIPAVQAGIDEQEEAVKAIAKVRNPTFDNVIVALDRSGKILNKVLPVFFGVSSAETDEQLDSINMVVAPMLSAHYDNIYMNADLFNNINAVYTQREQLGLDGDQLKLVEETYKSFKRRGAGLSPENQKRLRELNQDISLLQITFEQNMLAETNAFKLEVSDEKQIAGLPQTLRDAAAADARAAGKNGWVFTLKNPSIMPFLQYADNRELRQRILEAYLNRGNNNNDKDNKRVVKQLVEKRLEKAKLLGYINYADYALSDRMAQTPENVYSLLTQIWEPALAKAREEAADMVSYIRKSGQKFDLEAWDWRYYAEKVKKSKFDFDEEALRPYFKLDNVRDGVFYVANRLYGITFNELKGLPTYSSEVVTYECKDADGSLLGLIYFDFFPRPGKSGGAWCGTYRDETYVDGKRVPPIVTIVCNFTRPAGDAPALLTPDEVETLFHEFGHGLHNLFCKVRYYGVLDVPRDFVELPSQIMEHWPFRPEVLENYARHYKTGEVIPAGLVKKIQQSKTFGQGFATTEYLAASLLDMDYHILTNTDDLDVLAFEKASMEKVGLIRQIPPRYRSTYFAHTMGGGYTAGYYSYIWAEVLDCDAFQAFVEAGNVFDRHIANAFRKEILEKGGSEDAMTMYYQFRGAEPQIGALLENRGLNTETNNN